jgi:phosphopantetheinyl transferase
VRQRLGNDVSIGYNAAGAPVLNDGRGYISVSHTRGWVAVVWSPEPCAVDIELKTRRLSAAAGARYNITSIEDWCALEARYKFAGLTGRQPKPESDAVSFLPHPELVVAVILRR